MILYSNTIKLYYNRIVYSILSVAIQRLEIPIQSIKYIFSVTQVMYYFIRIAYSYSINVLDSSMIEIPN